MDLVGYIVFCWLIWLGTFPEAMGQSFRIIYDKFLSGWQGNRTKLSASILVARFILLGILVLSMHRTVKGEW